MPESVPTSLYRHFASDGTLLYVGISLSWFERTRAHAAHSDWFSRVCRVEIEWFPSRAEALVAETIAIKAEKPLFNLHHNKVTEPVDHRQSHQRLTNYVVGFRPLYSMTAAAAALDVSIDRIRQEIAGRRLGYVEIGTRRMVTGWQLIDWLEAKEADK